MDLQNNMFIIKNKALYIGISVALVVASLLLIFFKGINWGIDFTGGSQTEVSYENTRPELSLIQNSLSEAGFGNLVLQPTGETGLLVRTRDLSETERVSFLKALDVDGTMQEGSFTSIGPSIGKELQNKAIIALIFVSLAVILFIAYVFRGVSSEDSQTKQVSSWKYGFIAVLALLHDIIVTAGAFTLLGILTGAQADSLFVVALLTILGLSVNDTIVVFDRVRENLARFHQTLSFNEIVGKSVKDSFTRSINTSLTTIIVLLALAFFGPESTKMFALTLTFGMFFGTYSSLFLASPLLVFFYERQSK